MELTIYKVDAFTNQLFSGNPAAVCPLETWLPSTIMQKIALENNLSETAFIVQENEGYHIRWFTPAIEVDLCGHATLATAHVLFSEMKVKKQQLVFNSRSGLLTVTKSQGGYIMDFPVDQIEKVDPPIEITAGLGIKPIAVYKGKDDYLAIFDQQQTIEDFKPDFNKLAQLKTRGIITSAKGKNVDFVSRCFYPAAGINEDPVTGSAHTTMIPYWSKILGKTQFSAKQLSTRGGEINCELQGDRVNIEGKAITYMKGIIHL